MDAGRKEMIIKNSDGVEVLNCDDIAATFIAVSLIAGLSLTFTICFYNYSLYWIPKSDPIIVEPVASVKQPMLPLTDY
jgi:hypothetical protein